MAVGDLSPDQARYVDLVAKQTGLARDAVVAWVGAESGWGRTKAGHNYLNVGPGETYPSTEQAAARAAALITSSGHYHGIRAAIPAGGAAQVEAIGESPWGTSPALVKQVYADLMATTGRAVPVDWKLPGLFPVPVPDLPGLPSPQDVAGGITGAVGSAAGEVISALVPVLLETGLTIVFTVAAFAFFAMGVARLTGTTPKEIFDQVSGVVGSAGTVAKLAAV